MKYFIGLLVIGTAAAATWSFAMWRGSGFFVFDHFYLDFKPDLLKDSRLSDSFDQTCRRVFFEGLWPAWAACFGWMVVTAVLLYRRKQPPKNS